ncbi:sugar kinase [Pseudogracilibacillus sp. SE30717A]|uniref:sugar kinase n=1 Tax=Pseudogracilibacillus sp. SE30717A TaxID=3098293 RepID=UPI00300DFC2A
MKKIVTFGEPLLRYSTSTGKRIEQSGELNIHYGGAEVNVSVSLANFGYDAYFIGKIPENGLGKAVERHLKSYGVHTDYLIKGGERLGTYYLELGAGERSSQVIYDRKYSSFAEIKLEEIDFEEIFTGAELYHVTGITPALSPALQELTMLSLQKAREMGVITSFDFNYRSKLWTHKEAATAIQPFLPYIDICSCGELDAIHLLDIEEITDEMDRELRLEHYYKEILKRYSNIKHLYSTFRDVNSASIHHLQGNYYYDGILYQSKIHHVDPIVDPVGGGDAFAAGMLYGILENLPCEQTVSFATAGAALKHTLVGDANQFSKEEIFSFVDQVSGKIIR